MPNDKKISIITCVNNDRYWDECLFYLSDLYIPDGYEVNIIEIRDAKSMCSGYNEGMNSSDATYKIYMHQDVFITDKWFLYELLDIFNAENTIGMVGLVGSVKLPEDAVVWHGPRVSTIYRKGNNNIDILEEKPNLLPDRLAVVDAVDGLLIATNRDIEWREDLFIGWDFYDASQAREFMKAGYKVVVPDYNRPIAVHDDGMVLNLENYDHYRKIFINEYMK